MNCTVTVKWKDKLILSVATGLLLTALPLVGLAQADPPPDVQDIPLDGGLSVLIAAGVGYGARKMHQARKKNRATSTNNS